MFAGLEFPTRNGRSKAKRPVRHRFAPIRLKSTFEALRREGSDFTDLQFALAGHVCATRTLNAVRVRRPGKSERLHPTGNAPPSHHSSVRLNFGTCKCSTFAVSSVRSRRARPPHVGKGSDTRTEPCQERIRRWSRMSLARPGRMSRAPNSAKEAESAENGQGAGFALDAFDAAVSCAGVKEGRKAYRPQPAYREVSG